MKSRSPLDAWLYGTHVATISDDGARGRVSLRWTRDAVERWGVGARVVSELLPIAPPGEPRTIAEWVSSWRISLLKATPGSTSPSTRA